MKRKKIKNIAICMLATLSIGLISTSPASAAWKKDNIGWWNTEGNSYSIGWRFINNNWYHFASSGYMSTGWVNDNGTWYYLDKNSGSMKTGWVNDNGTWYYLNNVGAMQTGFITLNNNTYYLNTSGAMVTGNIQIDGVNYTFAQSGEKITSSAAEVSSTDNASNNASSNVPSTDSSSAGSSGGSGGSGGGGGSSSNASSSSNLSVNSSYSDLYGTWKVQSHVSSNMKSELSEEAINLAIGEKFIVSKNQITSVPLTISNPITKEETLTSSEFSDKYGDTLSNLGISGDKAKCISVTRSDNTNHSVDLIITQNGKVFAIVKNTVFQLVQA